MISSPRLSFLFRFFIAVVMSFALAPPLFAAGETWDGGVVAADHPVAAAAGLKMLEAGGNAIDAAVAAGFCLSVVRPYSCGVGGGGFLVAYLNDENGGRSIALDFRETAPSSVGPDYFESLEADSTTTRYSGSASGVPGSVAGLLLALEKYGTLDRQTVLAPAIEAAQGGFVVDAHYAATAAEVAEWYDGDPQRKEQFPFVWERLLLGGNVREGDRISLPEQGELLRGIARRGVEAFYEGPVAAAIARAVREAGGVLLVEDLADYRVRETNPLITSALDRRFLTMPPPSSGGIAQQQIFGFLGHHADILETCEPNDGMYIHLVAEAMKHAFADRAEWLADPAYADVPTAHLISDKYIEDLSKLFDPKRTIDQNSYGTRMPPPDDAGTSHLSIIDVHGNAVASTQTINLAFGSRVAVPQYGFVMNNEMDDFLTVRGTRNAYGLQQSTRNLPEPGKRPLSSMSPTIVLSRDGVEMVAGASGGPRIISGTVQAILNVLLFDMSAIDAVTAPRFHHQWVPNHLKLERGLRARELGESLFGKGHTPKAIENVGVVQLIRKRESGFEGAADPRKGGAALGLTR